MTTSGDSSNKNQRKVLTITSIAKTNVPESIKGKQSDAAGNPVIVINKKPSDARDAKHKETDFSFEKRKIRDLSNFSRKPIVKNDEVISKKEEIPVVTEQKQVERHETKKHFHKKEVNFSLSAKKQFRNLDVRNKNESEKPKDIITKKDEPKTVQPIAAPKIKPVDNSKKKIIHSKAKSSFHDDENSQSNAAKNKNKGNFNKISAAHLAKLASDDYDGQSFRRNHAKKKKKSHTSQFTQEKVLRDIIIGEVITVADLAAKMSEKGATVIKALMKLGVMVTINQTIDADTAELVANELGHRVQRVTEESVMKNLIGDIQINEENLEKRAPVVTVMGHVDHGKTSLLDALRKTDVAAREHGGITQHIGAYEVHLPNNQSITFLDTPGHEAFSAMRMRGAKVTDIIILVVAADDGIKAQTIEAISHAKAAQVPIIVAVNKMDKPSANFEFVKQSLLQHDILPDDLGGDVMVIGISAMTGYGLNDLIDAILLQADLLDLKASHSGRAKGYIVEARLDKIKGFTASMLIQSGQLKIGDILVAGHVFGRVRTMTNDKGLQIKSAGPSVPVEITGLDSVPTAGDEFVVMQNERSARDLVEMLATKAFEQKHLIKPKSLHERFIESRETMKEIAIIIKADTHGSAEAILHSLNKIDNDEVKVRVLHYGAGGINESDIMLAATSKALIVAFNVRPNANAKEMAVKMGVEMKFYSIIYNLLDDVKAILSDALSPIEREEVIGLVEIRKVFDTSKFGKIGGCYVKEGVVRRNASMRLIRDNQVIHTGTIQSLKRQKDDAKEVKEGFECGITLDHYDDIRELDCLEVFEIRSEKKTL